MGQWVKVSNIKDIQPGSAVQVDVQGKKIAVFNINGKYYALDDECTHAGGSLAEGEITGMTVACPWHGAKFDIEGGGALSAPAFEPVNHYKVQVKGEDIQIEIP